MATCKSTYSKAKKEKEKGGGGGEERKKTHRDRQRGHYFLTDCTTEVRETWPTSPVDLEVPLVRDRRTLMRRRMISLASNFLLRVPTLPRS